MMTNIIDINEPHLPDITYVEAVDELVEELEGGWVHHRVKGEGFDTYAGISERAHPDRSFWSRVRDGTIDRKSVRDIYRDDYWNRMRLSGMRFLGGNSVHANRMAFSIFAFAVHAGVRKASRILQAVVELPEAEQDGVVGERTLERVSQVNLIELRRRWVLAVLTFYLRLGERSKHQRAYLRGYVRRLLEAEQGHA